MYDLTPFKYLPILRIVGGGGGQITSSPVLICVLGDKDFVCAFKGQ